MSNRLFLDISSTCTGYVITSADKDVTILEYGAIWFHKDDKTADKCYKLYSFVSGVDDKYSNMEQVVFESYSFNLKNPNGSLVCPQLQGAVMAAAKEAEWNIEDITPQTWRKQCGIKPVKTEKKKRDYKIPTEAYFRGRYNIPGKIISNVTGNLRTTPNDVFDALGVCEGYYRLTGLTEFKMGEK